MCINNCCSGFIDLYFNYILTVSSTLSLKPKSATATINLSFNHPLLISPSLIKIYMEFGEQQPQNLIEISSPELDIYLTQITADNSEEFFTLVDNNRDFLEAERISHRFTTVESVRESFNHFYGQRRTSFSIKNSNQELIGFISLMKTIRSTDIIEIGYFLDERFTHKGNAAKAVKVLSDYAFDVMNYQRVQAYVKFYNDASIRVLARCGFVCTGEYEDGVAEFTLYKDYRIPNPQ